FISPLSAQSAENFLWDSVETVSSRNSCFPVALSDESDAFIFYESVDKIRQEIKITYRRKAPDRAWSDTFFLPDTFRYSGDEVPDMYSAAVSQNGLAVSVLDAATLNGVIKVYFSDDRAENFSVYSFPPQKKQITSSRIFSLSDGSFVLFVSLGEGKQSPTESSFSLLYAVSSDGKFWSDLKDFSPASKISNAFSPFLSEIGGKDFVFFEGWYEKDMTTSLIYGSELQKNGNSLSWGEPFCVTDSSSMTDSSEKWLDYKNFRPFVLSDGINTKMVWERTAKNANTASVMVAPLNYEGRILDKNDVEALNQFGNGRRPSLFLYNEKFFALWFDDRNGVNTVHLSENLGVQWVEINSVTRRLNLKNATTFPSASLIPSKDSKKVLALFFQENSGNNQSVSILSEDYSVKTPVFTAKNFTAGKRGSTKSPSVRINLPDDISGLRGVSAIWTFDENENPPEDMFSGNFRTADKNTISAQIPSDLEGDQKIYFKARALDNAGNWSSVATLEYYLDQTPPLKVTDISFPKDEWGFALTNDVSFSWKNDESDTDEIAGYSWTLTRVSPLEKNLQVTKTKKLNLTSEESNAVLAALTEKNEANFAKAKIPSEKASSKSPKANYRNRDNGIYVFSVRAIDSVGNAGEVESVVLFLNKYKAATVIKNVLANADDLGNVAITISGEEFSYDGRISEVIITKNEGGQEFVFKADKNDYQVKKGKGDTEIISGIKIDGMKAGTYTVRIRHSERGLSTWKKSLVISENGTIKYEKNYNFEPEWKIFDFPVKRFELDTQELIFWTLLALIMFGILVCVRGILNTAREAVLIRRDVSKILKGEYMAEKTLTTEEIVKMNGKLKVQVSLKFKFGLAITALLLFIVAGVSLTIGWQMSKTQEKILIQGLKDRVKTVMGNMSSGVQSYLDDGRDKLVELGAIVNQTDNFEEAHFATILSYEIDGKALDDGSRPLDYVWATNDENIVRKINSVTFDAGTVRFGNQATFFAEICRNINEEAKKIVGELSDTTGDISSLIFKKLNDFSASKSDSYPKMSDERLDRNVTEYVFYWPVMYQRGNDKNTFLQAMIIMDVSTDTLVSQIDASRRLAMSIAFIAAIVAAGIGLVSAFLISSIIVSPIQRVVSHVKKITDTEDKLLLDGLELKIRSHDELRTLGDSVNEMTKGLVKGARDERRAKIAFERAAKERERAAAAEAQEAKARAKTAEMNIMNLDGQAVQKAFIPLVSDGAEKETTASYSDKALELFGYYEGTDAVSGDYFDYKKLDDRWYAFIKCDASGHGVPAALIMTIVATIFRRYFASWKFDKNGVKLNLLAADINDFIESLGLRGKFAAMMICLLDTKTGDVYTCNAGDNILRIFDSAEKKIKVITLHEAPAAGPLPSFMVEMKGGYKVEKIHLKPNDVLFLYTDGIEESTRFFRNENFEIVKCDEAGLKEGEVHDTHKKGEQSEQMEPARVQNIIESVLNRKKYVLKRYHSPVSDERLEFDFTKCEGTIEEAIIALTAVEKVFRMYKKPNSTGKVEKSEMDLEGKKKTVIQISGDGIKIDRKIDAFLEKYFNLYGYYCTQKVDEGETNYVYYTGVSEDVQADDLTLLAIKKI
ncbi:MAG: SpoIIE family protein phosphatase, partial [Treponema sp.]|nr:SpoIIE family protein phosphatase [Treponema sp.]